MNAQSPIARLTASLQPGIQHLHAKLQGVSTRDRLALWVAALAALLGLEFTVIGPLQSKAARMAEAERAQAEEVQAERQQQEELRKKQETELRQRLAQARKSIDQQGVVQSSSVPAAEAVAALFAGRSVRVLRVSTRMSAVDMPASEEESETKAPPAEGHSEPDKASTKLFAHRVEVELSGPLPAVMGAARSIGAGSMPWRLLAVAWKRGEPGQVVATCTLGTDSTSATWLRL